VSVNSHSHLRTGPKEEAKEKSAVSHYSLGLKEGAHDFDESDIKVSEIQLLGNEKEPDYDETIRSLPPFRGMIKPTLKTVTQELEIEQVPEKTQVILCRLDAIE